MKLAESLFHFFPTLTRHISGTGGPKWKRFSSSDSLESGAWDKVGSSERQVHGVQRIRGRQSDEKKPSFFSWTGLLWIQVNYFLSCHSGASVIFLWFFVVMEILLKLYQFLVLAVDRHRVWQILSQSVPILVGILHWFNILSTERFYRRLGFT